MIVMAESKKGSKFYFDASIAIDSISSPLEMAVIELSMRDGAIPDEDSFRRKSLSISITGNVEGSDKDDLENKISKYKAFFTTNKLFKLWRYDTSARFTWCYVETFDIKYNRGFSGRVAEFDISCVGYSALWYSNPIQKTITGTTLIEYGGTLPASIFYSRRFAGNYSLTEFLRNDGVNICPNSDFSNLSTIGWTGLTGSMFIPELSEDANVFSIPANISRTIPISILGNIQFSVMIKGDGEGTIVFGNTTKNYKATDEWTRVFVSDNVYVMNSDYHIASMTKTSGTVYIKLPFVGYVPSYGTMDTLIDYAPYNLTTEAFSVPQGFVSGDNLVVSNEGYLVANYNNAVMANLLSNIKGDSLVNPVRLFPGVNVVTGEGILMYNEIYA